ncbi:MAG: twin-arginine translocase TatA/TatE family subunit [Candidatus Altiarchaeota archaeon]|nr:twin-arginine translocase TatA/TatE family subunit [Candidatus Altiarchaeota archaeon]
MIGTLELLLIFIMAVILFGPEKLPELARSLAEAVNEFKKAVDDLLEDDDLAG